MLLADLTTLRLGGAATEIVTASTADELVQAVRSADEIGLPVLLIAGGSNLVIADEGFDGRVVLVRTSGITVADDLAACGGATVTVAAGEPWDDFVAQAVAQEWIGVEALAGIPGAVGATPIQNVGAYGQEVSSTIASVRTWDRQRGAYKTHAAADCGFGYRMSGFKAEPDRYVVLSVTFQFKLGNLGAPIAYAELARTLGCSAGERAPLRDVREAVLGLRRAKGMVLDADDHDSWSAGSFFLNPVLSAAEADALPKDAPRFPQADGTIKTSAAWLIDHAGFVKGYATPASQGRVSLSTKHVLALTNRGSATTTDLLELAREVRSGVERAVGITLEPEPNLVACSL